MRLRKLGIFASALVAVAMAVPLAVMPVQANSAIMWEQGVTASGVIMRTENSELKVDSEKLVFDVCDLPAYGCEDYYKTTFKAEYVFNNPTGGDITAKLAFPSGALPEYFKASDNFAAQITADGVELPVETRHTGGRWYSDFKEQVKKIADEWYSDGFYNKDLTVTEYKVSVPSVEIASDETLECKAEIDGCDKSKVRYICDSYEGGIIINLTASEPVGSFYVLGDPSAYTLNWSASIYKRGKRTLKECEVVATPQIPQTLKHLVLKNYDSQSGISEMDWYNAVVPLMGDSAMPYTLYSLNAVRASDFLIWYVYDLTVPAGQTVVNKISAPIFPDIRSHSRYSYEYYLSPAACWADFGTLEVIIRTEYEVSNLPEGFTKCMGGYKATYLSLPEGEMSFSISRGQSGGYIYNEDEGNLPVLIVLLVVGVMIAGECVALIIIAAKKGRRR